MIKSVHMKNFRQHRDLSLDFSQGTSVIRAANEAGKSTVFEAISYAMFGARSARNSDITTWGEPEGSHQVTLVLDVGGTEYAIKRNPRSAEINYEGGRVTGQGPTAAFIEELLELKPGTGTKLMMVPQNEMRGTLTDGGAKTTAMIEQLADLDQIDDIIAKLQAHWHTGKTDLLQHTLQTFRDQRREAQDLLRETPDPRHELAQQKKTLSDEVSTLRHEVETLKVKSQKAKDAWHTALDVERETGSLDEKLKSYDVRLEVLQREADAECLPDLGEQVDKAVTQLEALQQRQKAYRDWLTLADWNPKRLPMTKENLQAECAAQAKLSNDLLAKMHSVQAEAKLKRQSICSDLTCPTCQREWDDAESRKVNNERLMSEVGRLEAEAGQLQDTIRKVESELDELRPIVQAQVPTLAGDTCWYVSDTSCYPPKFEWNGEVPTEVTKEHLQQAQRHVDDLRAGQIAYNNRQRRLGEIDNEIQAIQEERQKTQGKRQALPVLEHSSEVLNFMADQAYKDFRAAIERLNGAEEALKRFDRDSGRQIRQYDTLVERLATAEREVKRYEQELAEAGKANALLKALRAMRPSIANQVWQSVCQSVSHYFSVMRGTPSVVSRESNGFVADGHDVSSLSGSTLDVLGLAIRVALTKTFIPSCRFLLLDEPFSAADAERTSQALGFISTLGFDQVVIITHEDATEAVADHLITL